MYKIVFIYTAPLARAPAEKAGLDHLVDKGVSVRIWDLSSMYYSREAISGYFAASSSHAYSNPLVPVTQVLSRQHFASLLNSNRDSKFLFATFYHGDSYWVLRVLRKYNITFFFGYLWPPYPFDESKSDLDGSFLSRISSRIISALAYVHSLKRAWCDNSPACTLHILSNRIALLVRQGLYRFTSYYQKPCFFFASGTEGVKHWSSLLPSSRVVSVDSNDILVDPPLRAIHHDYIVFVDDAVCYSPDQALHLRKAPTCDDYSGYLIRMESLFDYLEDSLSVQVVIGASFKYQYPSPMLCGRPIYYGQTRELIYHSRYVLAHGSSATFQAAFCLKPMCMISDIGFSEEKKVQVLNLARMYNSRPVFSHDPASVLSALVDAVTNDSYPDFVQKYLVSTDSQGKYLDALYARIVDPV